jgi:hypothetical protein
MIDVLANRTYRHLFAAQVIALAGTGLLTVALGLLAFDLAGERAGVVLGTALAIKMIAYVSVAPVVGGFADQLPRRAFLVGMDLLRAAIALLLPATVITATVPRVRATPPAIATANVRPAPGTPWVSAARVESRSDRRQAPSCRGPA